jgi:YkoY family integral membrane protein
MQMDSGDISIIFSIVLLEGLLSVDNALVNASLASGLAYSDQKKAIRFGIFAGAALRLVALFFAAAIIRFPIVKTAGAAYLIYLMVKNLFFSTKGDHDHKTSPGELRHVIVAIAFADIAFSIDNVVAAVGMSPKFSVVVIGVFAGIATMMFATQLMVLLIRRYKLLEKSAYLIVGVVGLFIMFEELFNFSLDQMYRFYIVMALIVGTLCIEEYRIFRRKRRKSSGTEAR